MAERLGTVRPGPTPGMQPRSRQGLVVLLTLIGLGALTVSLLGPLGFDAIVYHVSAGAADQLRGGDVAGLLVVAPLSLVAARLVARSAPGAPALAIAPAAYGLYLYTQLAISGDPGRYAGNTERWFALFWVLVAACGAVLVAGGVLLSREPEPSYRRGLERASAWYLLLVVLFLVVGLHLPGLADAARETPASEEYLADPVVFWVVKLMDLAYVAPALVAVAVGLLRSRGWARRLLAPAVGWTALLGASVAGMAVTMILTDAPGASLGLTIGFAVFTALAASLAVTAYREVLRRRLQPGQQSEPEPEPGPEPGPERDRPPVSGVSADATTVHRQ